MPFCVNSNPSYQVQYLWLSCELMQHTQWLPENFLSLAKALFSLRYLLTSKQPQGVPTIVSSLFFWPNWGNSLYWVLLQSRDIVEPFRSSSCTSMFCLMGCSFSSSGIWVTVWWRVVQLHFVTIYSLLSFHHEQLMESKVTAHQSYFGWRAYQTIAWSVATFGYCILTPDTRTYQRTTTKILLRQWEKGPSWFERTRKIDRNLIVNFSHEACNLTPHFH